MMRGFGKMQRFCPLLVVHGDVMLVNFFYGLDSKVKSAVHSQVVNGEWVWLVLRSIPVVVVDVGDLV